MIKAAERMCESGEEAQSFGTMTGMSKRRKGGECQQQCNQGTHDVSFVFRQSDGER
jgi:hypothetical protein